jgi:hypothetical protein
MKNLGGKTRLSINKENLRQVTASDSVVHVVYYIVEGNEEIFYKRGIFQTSLLHFCSQILSRK